MPVNSLHPDYLEMLNAWSRARDVIAGEDAVKAAGEKYLLRLDSQTDDEYVAKVVSLGRDMELRTRLRATQRERMIASPVCDGHDLARALEDAFEAMSDATASKSNPRRCFSLVSLGAAPGMRCFPTDSLVSLAR